VVVHSPVESLTETHTHNSVNLSWINPVPTHLEGIIIKQDGEEIVELSNTTNTYEILDLMPETTYLFEVLTKFTDGVIETPAGEVENVVVEAEPDRVNLSWDLPESENFQHVNIYRDATKIFETNGTYFNDLTVVPQKTYEYKLTTMSDTNIESSGVTKVVEIPLPPPPIVEGGEFEKDEETGDYTFRWTAPTTGKVEIYVGGNLYATVNAADLQIVIPADDMKFTLLGDPDVKMKAIDEYGQGGEVIKPPSTDGGTGGAIDVVEVPFSPVDLLTTGVGLFAL
ncbi:hypothetical protein RhiirA1_482884, partial [Rhizophagus irregularis]